ncbi:ArgS-related anticodon-binding protein NrtL [Streptomyces sp. NPDC052013]|uniref:ArgS-related anticodon-binding protein NrtL n=1 Tax=Streptomyces sp. NPDC052013 TaxID=3365679 RepID=UPI0037D88160
MTPVELSRTVLRAVRRAVDDGELSVAVPERAVVAPPGPGGCGDYATNIALQLARPAGQPPLRVAEVLRPHLLRTGAIADVVVTGPGFLNISLRSTAPVALVQEILRAGIQYGHSDALAGQCFRLRASDEVRAVVHADVLARILRSQGAVVSVDCATVQLRPEWVAVLGLRLPTPEPERAPAGDLRHLPAAAKHHTRAGRPHSLADKPQLTPGDKPGPALTDTPGPALTDTPEPALTDTPEPALADKPQPVLADKPGPALTDTPEPALADKPQPILADKPGPALTDTPEPVLADNTEPAPAVEQTDPAPAETTLTLRPVPAPTTPLPLGRDAARWALLHPASHDRPRITPEHLSQREGNPLFRVRYAHARTRALLRNAADLGFTPEPGPDLGGEATLLTAMADHPRILTAAATHRAPDRLARHLVTVADALQPLLPTVLPLGAEKPSAAHRARLALAEAAGTVLAGGLSLLGIDAPDHL